MHVPIVTWVDAPKAMTPGGDRDALYELVADYEVLALTATPTPPRFICLAMNSNSGVARFRSPILLPAQHVAAGGRAPKMNAVFPSLSSGKVRLMVTMSSSTMAVAFAPRYKGANVPSSPADARLFAEPMGSGPGRQLCD